MQRVAVIGAGLMGSGIAVYFSMNDFDVTLLDVSEELLTKSRENIKSILKELTRLSIIQKTSHETILNRIKFETNLEKAVESCWLVTEAVSEDLDVKRKLFKRLDDLCSEDVILASNTSSFKISDIAADVENKERIIGTHWWNPPYLMPLVEIIKTNYNSDEMVSRLAKFFEEKMNKKVIICRDSPGGVGVRLQAALIAEAMRMIDEKLIDPESIDTVVKLTLGLRFPFIGPFQIADLGGLDIFLHAHEYLSEKLGERFKPSKVLVEKVEKGMLGAKKGEGFYRYTTSQVTEIVKKRNEITLEILKLQKRYQAI